MALTVPIPLAFGRFKQLPQRSSEVWQGALVRLQAWIDHPTDPAGEPYRPIGALWVSLRTGLIHLALPAEGVAASAEFAFTALLEFALKWAKGLEGRPGRVEVRDAALRDALADALASASTPVVVVDDVPAVRDALRNLEAAASDGHRFPGLLHAGTLRARPGRFARSAVTRTRSRVIASCCVSTRTTIRAFDTCT